ncbi:MAG: SIS domain-containing protein [Alphaproteobacteria bacterium]
MDRNRTFSGGYLPPGTEPGQVPGPGLTAILQECRRQHQDALATLATCRPALQEITESLGRTGRALLLGMGASHFVNQIAAARLRARGIDGVAVTLSEQLAAPLPSADRTVILLSQSGDSAEVEQYLAATEDLRHHVGLTLSADSALGRAVPVMVAAGGRETGFAATRSFTLSLVLYSMILDRLGANGSEDGYDQGKEHIVHWDLEEVLAKVPAGHRSMIYSGRGTFDGVAAMAALGSMELGRMPALCLEGGQLRHGPIEMLSADTTVVLFRAPGTEGHGTVLAGFIHQAGGQLIVFDAADGDMPPGAHSMKFVPGEGLASVFAMLPSVQAWMIGLASRSNPVLGVPRFCEKVTRAD